MPFNIISSDLKKCISGLPENNLLIALNIGPISPTIEALGFNKISGFENEDSGCVTRIYSDSCSRLILIYEYSDTTNSLENRWLISRHFRNFNKLNSKSVVSFFCRGRHLDFAIIDDLISIRSNHLYEFSNQGYTVYCSDILDQDDAIALKTFSFKRWINENPDYLTSIEIGNRMEHFCKTKREIEFDSLDLARLKSEGLNLLLLVGRASTISPPRLHIAKYRPNNRTSKSPITLIGKGITFDSGGINVKPFEGYVNTMKNDMGGAALAWHIFKYLVEIEVDRDVTVVIPTCENAVDQLSMKPGDIVESHSGSQVIIDHTDAEGRLILADAISYSQTKLNSKKLFTMATLTTAALQQYGCFTTPVFFMSEKNQKLLDNYAETFGEEFCYQSSKIWFSRANQHPTGALTNRGRLPSAAEMGGRSNTAAHFLQSFSRVELTHFDIFNTVWNWSGEYPGHPFGATGANLRSLCKFFTECD